MAIGCPQNQKARLFRRPFATSFFDRIPLRLSERLRLTPGSQRATGTRRVPTGAKRCAEIHHRLIKCGDARSFDR
jgi:hypothetical protein